ncbi:hypothetical protein Hanom_Chr00s095799g01801151 [Helianthus anomalus]
MINRGQLLKKDVSLETSVGALMLSRVLYTIHLRPRLIPVITLGLPETRLSSEIL